MNRFSYLLGSLRAVLFSLCVILIAFGTPRSEAQTRPASVDVLQVNLDPLIDAAAKDRNRFAVTVSHSIDPSRIGTWSVSGGIATWRYSLRIPTAVSLSFHATSAVLPASAQLTVRGGGSTYTYRAADINKQELWSRISKGDSLDLELTVAPQDRRAVVLVISSLQAGYRGFGPAVADHPHYARLKLQTRVASTSSCIVNYECDATSANTPAGQATVAIIIGNAYQCSGTLINDVPQDGKPYILTARHCEAGKLGGGHPEAASTVVVYWDATSLCGSPLGTLYDPGIPTQQGASSVAEQQDAWLLLLAAGPVVNDAYLSGFDASGGQVQGGYTVHHALSNDKQYTGWNGQAFAGSFPSGSTLNVSYVSNFWEVVNRVGTIGPGASGSALFDQNNRLVGSLSLGATTGSTDDGYSACPSASPPAPNAQNAVGYFTSLAAVWNSTADSTSTTPTIRQILDPNNTASLVVNSMHAPASVHLSASQVTLTIGFDVTLTWSAPGATACTPSGGVSGDGWTGSLAASGNQTVRESVAGAVTFGITCAFADGHTSQSQVVVTWVPPAPLVNLFAPRQAWVGGTWTLQWSTNAPPCQLTGGSVSQALTGSDGTISVVENTAGQYTYHIACGTGSQVASEDAFVEIIPPVIKLVADTTDLRLGQALEFGWSSLGNSCTPTGGSANDGWSGTQLGPVSSFSFFPTALGTYTYTIRCMQGAASAQATTTITVENDPPYATLTVSSNEIAMGQTMTASYKSNIAFCILSQNRVGNQAQGIFGFGPTGGSSEGTEVFSGGNVGASQLVLSCGTNPTIVTSSPQTVTVDPAVSATLSVSPNATTGSAFTLSWQTSDASSCSAAGGGDGAQWTGNVAVPSGQQTITPSVAGTLTYTLTCVGHVPTDVKTAQVAVTVTAAAAQNPPPAGNSGGSGSSSSGSGGGGGGGGALDELTLAVLVLALFSALNRTRNPRRTCV